MILKAFKEKSNQKYINKLLSSRKSTANNSKVKSVGVLLNASEFDDLEAFSTYFKSLGLISPKNKTIVFTLNPKPEKTSWEEQYSPKSFGWGGKIKSIDLQQFIDTDFGVLVSYYNEDILELDQITAMSKANFKVGLSRKDERLYDLIIDISVKRFDLFKTEFQKYLTILNKL